MSQRERTAIGSGASFILHHDDFLAVTGDHPKLEKVVDTDAHEGPVYVAGEDALYFTSVPQTTDIPVAGSRQVALRRVQLQGTQFPLPISAVTTIREDANMANGMILDRNGGLLICEQGTRSQLGRISRMNLATGSVETVVDQWRNLRFNSPNDVVAKSDGTIWFTDPSYGYLQGFRPQPMIGNYVYRYDPLTDSTRVVADNFTKPNGLAFSPDEQVLYINDSGSNTYPDSYVSGPHHILAFDVIEGRNLSNQCLFAVIVPGFPDGMKVDERGNVYVSSFSGVQVYNPSGDLLGEIMVPNAVNFIFGGADNNILFITNDTSIWAATLQTAGAVPPTA